MTLAGLLFHGNQGDYGARMTTQSSRDEETRQIKERQRRELEEAKLIDDLKHQEEFA